MHHMYQARSKKISEAPHEPSPIESILIKWIEIKWFWKEKAPRDSAGMVLVSYRALGPLLRLTSNDLSKPTPDDERWWIRHCQLPLAIVFFFFLAIRPSQDLDICNGWVKVGLPSEWCTPLASFSSIIIIPNLCPLKQHINMIKRLKRKEMGGPVELSMCHAKLPCLWSWATIIFWWILVSNFFANKLQSVLIMSSDFMKLNLVGIYFGLVGPCTS